MSLRGEGVFAKQHLAANFNTAARDYDDRAVLQRTVADELLDRLDLMKLEPQRILDLGSGTGGSARVLARHFRRARVVQLDLAVNMLQESRRRDRRWFSRQSYVCADAECLPLAEGTMDLVFSSLMLQWSTDLAGLLAEVLRALRPRGLFLFATLGPATLRELREAWLEAGDTQYQHVNPFHDMHEVGDALVHNGFADPVMETDTITLTYSRVHDLLRDLKLLGASNIQRDRRPGLTGKQQMNRMISAYEERRVDGRIPATYEVVYGHAWVPESRSPRGQGEVRIPVSSIARRRQ